MVRLQTALLLLSGCCGYSTPTFTADTASDVTADHLSLLQKRAVASRTAAQSATGVSADVPEPMTMLSQFADEDLHLRVEPHPRRAWRRSQGLPVARKHQKHTKEASLYSGAKAGPRHASRQTVKRQRSAWAGQAARVAKQTRLEELAEMAKVTENATMEASQAARLSELADIQSLYAEGAQASKAAKEHASEMWSWDAEDEETKEAQESLQHEELAAESAFKAEMRAEDVYAEEKKANASTNLTGPMPKQPALLSEVPGNLSEVREKATASSQANGTASSAFMVKAAGTVQSGGVQFDDVSVSGSMANISDFALAASRPISVDNSTEAAAVAVMADVATASDSSTETAADAAPAASQQISFDNSTDAATLVDAVQAPLPDAINSTNEAVDVLKTLREHVAINSTDEEMDVLLHEELKEHTSSEATPFENASNTMSLESDVDEGSAGVALENISPPHTGNASGAGMSAHERSRNTLEDPKPLKTKVVFEINGKNVSAAQALHVKTQQASPQAAHCSSVTIAPGAYYIVNAKREQYLSTLGSNVSVVKTDNATNDEHASGLQWRFDPVQGKNSTYHVVSVRYQKYLNTLGGPAQLWASTHPRDAAKGGPPSLEWRLQPAGQDDTYYVVNEGKQKYMDALSGAVSIWRGVGGLDDAGKEPGNIQWRLQRVETQEAQDCEVYVSAKNPGCLWTGNWSCPEQPVGVKGVAGGKGGQETIGFHCCCSLGLWAAPYAVDAVTMDARSF